MAKIFTSGYSTIGSSGWVRVLAQQRNNRVYCRLPWSYLHLSPGLSYLYSQDLVFCNLTLLYARSFPITASCFVLALHCYSCCIFYVPVSSKASVLSNILYSFFKAFDLNISSLLRCMFSSNLSQMITTGFSMSFSMTKSLTKSFQSNQKAV